jgi:hypothetical protein
MGQPEPFIPSATEGAVATALHAVVAVLVVWVLAGLLLLDVSAQGCVGRVERRGGEVGRG